MLLQGESLRKNVRRGLALAAGVFGVATIVAGERVLLGSDPGYRVYWPLVAFNTAMGVAYLIAGVLAWLSVRRGTQAAASILVVNALVLAWIVGLRVVTSEVATESVAAMSLRTVLWLMLWASLAWLGRGDGRGLREA